MLLLMRKETTTGGTRMKDAPFITAEQVATINEARTVLDAIAKNAHMEHDSQASGMIFARASAAANDLFLLLVWASTYGHEPLTKAQLHNERGEAEPDDDAGTPPPPLALHDLPVWGWAWQGDARDIER